MIESLSRNGLHMLLPDPCLVILKSSIYGKDEAMTSVTLFVTQLSTSKHFDMYNEFCPRPNLKSRPKLFVWKNALLEKHALDCLFADRLECTSTISSVWGAG